MIGLLEEIIIERIVVFLNKKYVFYILIIAIFSFPILSIEDIIPWGVALFFIHRSIKTFRENEKLRPVVNNTLLAGGIILVYNVITRVIENYLVRMWL